MTDPQADIAVSGGQGRYTTKVSPGWDFWPPARLPLGAIALGVTAAETDLARPKFVIRSFDDLRNETTSRSF